MELTQQTKKLIKPATIGAALSITINVIVSQSAGMSCCLFTIIGGAASTYLLKRFDGKLEKNDGIKVGLLSGVVFAIVNTLLIGVVFGTLLGLSTPKDFSGPGTGIMALAGVMMIVAMLASAVANIIISTIGGLLAEMMLRENKP